MFENFVLQGVSSHFFTTRWRQPAGCEDLFQALEPKKPAISHVIKVWLALH